MSIKTLLQRIGIWIKDFFQSIPEEIKEKAEIALQVTTKIKELVGHPVVDFVVSVTPTQIDNEAQDAIIKALDFIAHWLGCAEAKEIPNVLAGRHPDERNALLSKMASDIVAKLDKHELRESQYRVAVEAVYSHNKIS